MIPALGVIAAAGMGVLASAHCSVMCGGIAGALALGTDPKASRWPLLIAYQVGRISSYALAGASIAGIGALAVSQLDLPQVRWALRGFSALVLLLAGLAQLGIGRAPGQRIGNRLWLRLAPLARRLLPVRHVGQALAFGALWGWMPCGFVYSVLLLAWLSMDPLQSAAIMLAFGLGTVPALLLVQWRVGALRSTFARLGPQRLRIASGALMLAFATLTIAVPLAGPLLPDWVHHLLPLDCAPR